MIRPVFLVIVKLDTYSKHARLHELVN